jgi:hypothetical protein
MYLPPSPDQKRPQPNPALWEPTISRTDRAGLPGWESFPTVERRLLIEVLIQTARRRVQDPKVRLNQETR